MSTHTPTPTRLRSAWAITLLLALLVALLLPVFFGYLGGRGGIALDDPLLDALPPTDLSVPLFVLLYAVIALFVVGISRRPLLFLRAAQAYVLLLALRILTMALVPLQPPADYVALNDPVSMLFYPGQQPFASDLFFSGHTATVFLLYLAAPWRIGRPLLLLATVLIGLAVLVQHVHWTIDVLAAPVFAWIAWRLSAITMRLCRLDPIGMQAGD